MANTRAELQEGQYTFPYHYIPSSPDCGTDSKSRGRCLSLSWGYEYLCYSLAVAEKVIEKGCESVLDVGCGDGWLANYLWGRGLHAQGVDVSERAIGFARAFSKGANFHCGFAGDMSGKYDAVLLVEVLEHIPGAGVADLLNEAVSRVKPGGILLVSVPTTVEQVQAKHYRHYDESSLEEALSGQLYVMTKEEISRVYKRRRWREFVIRSTVNRRFVVHFPWLERYLWNGIWEDRWRATPDDGRHLVAVYRRHE